MRVSKAEVYKSIEQAAANIKAASNGDGRTSRAEMAVALKGLTGTGKALTDIFFRFVDNRDAAPGASVTARDLTKAIAYAKKHLIDNYDLNKNGLSSSEIARMSTTGQLAVKLAKERGAQGISVSGGEA